MKCCSTFLLLCILQISHGEVFQDTTFGISSVKQQPTPSEGDTVFNVFGWGFTTNTDVKIGVTHCSQTTWISSSKLKCNVPPGVGADLTVIAEDHGDRYVEFEKGFS